MVEAISIETLTKKLRDVFCVENQSSKKYSEVWLSEVDFGGLYQANKFELNVKSDEIIKSCSDEISDIVDIIFRELSEGERAQIWRVIVYDANDSVHCESDDILVYSEAEACK